MPRGEHFKKENPRINQVSFKVSDSELLQLKTIAKEANLSIAEWLRGKIVSPEQEISKKEEIVAKPEQVQAVKVEEVKPPKPEKQIIKKAKNYDKPAAQSEQMSMF
jgi:hypothetical protein